MKPVPPMTPWMPTASLPKANAKPTKYQQTAQIEKFVRILATTVPAFFCLEKPISRNMNPHCMNITTMPATMTHTVLSPTEVRPTVSRTSPLLLMAESTVSAEASPGATNAISSAAPTAGSTFSAILRLICPPPIGSACIEGHGRRRPPQRLRPDVKQRPSPRLSLWTTTAERAGVRLATRIQTQEETAGP